MKIAVIIAMLVIGCAACAPTPAPALSGPDGHTLYPDASYLYKGDLTRDGGTNCWYRCL
jgi:hypothetical protein